MSMRMSIFSVWGRKGSRFIASAILGLEPAPISPVGLWEELIRSSGSMMERESEIILDGHFHLCLCLSPSQLQTEFTAPVSSDPGLLAPTYLPLKTKRGSKMMNQKAICRATTQISDSQTTASTFPCRPELRRPASEARRCRKSLPPQISHDQAWAWVRSGQARPGQARPNKFYMRVRMLACLNSISTTAHTSSTPSPCCC